MLNYDIKCIWARSDMQKCKFCGRERRLVKSHVIPRSFFEIKAFHQKAPKKALSIVSDSEKLKPMRRPVGIYDIQLFCKNCENKFNRCDDYAFKLLNENRDLRKVLRNENGRVFGQYYDTYNYDLLKLFFMSVLLRASLSGDFFFQHVNLGPYTEILKEAIDSCGTEQPENFAVFLTYYAQIKSGPVIFPPAPQRIENVKFYNFHLGRVIFFIKVDKRSIPFWLTPFILKPKGKLILIKHDLRECSAYEVLKRTINNPANSKYFIN